MSREVRANPEEMRVFASRLAGFSNGLRDDMAGLQGAFTRVGETWNDGKYKEFASVFRQTMSLLRRFADTSDEFVRSLRDEGYALDEYLKKTPSR